MSLDPPLTDTAILAALNTQWLGRSLQVYDQVTSTNTVLSQLAADGAPTGAMVIAEYQAQGRGRQDRRWLAPRGSSLLFSLLFRPRWPAPQAYWLTMIAGLAAVETIESHSTLQAALKWPNDVMIWDENSADPQWCKAGGILLDTQLDHERLSQAVLGMGLNVNLPRRQLPTGATPATSLLAAGGRSLARIPLLAGFLQQLETRYEEAASGASPQPSWNERLLTRDRPVRVTTAHQALEGHALGADEWGRLLVRAADGELHRFAAADVTLR